MYFGMACLSMLVLLCQVVWVVDANTVHKRSTTGSEITTLRGLVAKIVSETEATRTDLKAKMDTQNAKIQAQTTVINNMNTRMDFLMVAQSDQQCERTIDSYDRYPLLDCKGHDIEGSVDGLELHECYSKCNMMKECKAFYYKKGGKFCFPKYWCEPSHLTPYEAGPGDSYIKKAISYFDHIRGTDCNGNDVTQILNADAEECTKECDKRVECVAVVFHVNNNECWLKRKCEASSYSRHAMLDLYVHNEREDILGFTKKPNYDCRGNDIKDMRIGVKSCAKECQRNSACASFTYKPSNSHCYIKHKCDNSYSDHGLVQYKKN